MCFPFSMDEYKFFCKKRFYLIFGYKIYNLYGIILKNMIH